MGRADSLEPDARLSTRSSPSVTTNWLTWTRATVAADRVVDTPRRVSIRRLSAAGPMPAGAASPTNVAAVCTSVARHSGSLTGENATNARAAPTSVTRPSAKATTVQRQSPVESADVISSTLMLVMTKTMATIGTTMVRTVRAPNRTSCCGSTSASGRWATSADRSSASTFLLARISSRVSAAAA